MSHPGHHPSIHHALGSIKFKKFVTIFAYVAGIGGSAAVVPQAIEAWRGPAPGMAISTWALFFVFGLMWLTYAITSRQKPLIVTNLISLTVNGAVILGWIVNNRF